MSVRTFWAGAALLGAAAAANAGVNTWSQVGPEGGEVREVVLHPTNPDIAVAIAYSGVYRTTNRAATWTRSSHDFQNPPYDLQLDPSDPNRVYVFSFSPAHIIVSTDGGVTFAPFANLPVANVMEPRLGLGTGGVMYLGADLRVFRSDDRGASWTERSPILLPSGARIRSLVVDPLDPNTVYAAAGADPASPPLFVTRDGGASWTQRNSAPNLVSNPLRSGELWSARFDGLWKSEDYAATWTNVEFATYVSSVAVNGLDVVAWTGNGVFRSPDGGSTWSDITGDLRNSGPGDVAAHPLDASLIVLSGAGISVPGDLPGTWVSRHAGILATRIAKFAADPTTDRIYAFTSPLAVSVGGGAYEPIDDRSLDTIGTPPVPKYATTIHARPGNLLVMLSNELVQTNDGGQSWSLIPGYPAGQPLQLRLLAGAAAAPQNLIAAGTPSAFRSSNGGLSWTPITTGLPADFATFDIEFAESDPSLVYFGPHVLTLGPPEVFGVYRSADGGTTWAPANSGIADLGAYDIEVDPTDARVVYAIAGDTFVKSTDSGGSWRTLRRSLTPMARIGIDPVHPQVLYIVDADNFVLRSVDGGESFETLRDFSTFPWWKPVAVSVDPLRSHVVDVGTGGFGIQRMSIEPDLELRFTAMTVSPAAGAMVSYTLLVTNQGPFGSSGARVTMQLAAEMTDISATSQGGSCTVEQRTVFCDLSSMAAQASIGMTVTARAPSEGFVTASANVEGDQPDPVASNNARSHSAAVSGAVPPSTPAPSSGGGGGGGAGLSLLLMLLSTIVLMRRMRYVES